MSLKKKTDFGLATIFVRLTVTQILLARHWIELVFISVYRNFTKKLKFKLDLNVNLINLRYGELSLQSDSS